MLGIDRDRSLDVLGRLLAATAASEQDGEVEVSIEELGPGGDRGAEVSFRLVEGAGLDQRPRQVVVGLRIVGIELDHALEGGDGRLDLVTLHELDAASEGRLPALAQRVERADQRIIEHDLDLPVLRELGARSIEVSQRAVLHPQMVVDDAALGLARERRFELRDRRRVLASRGGDPPQTEARRVASRIDRERLGERGLGLRAVVREQVQVARAQQCRHVVGP